MLFRQVRSGFSVYSNQAQQLTEVINGRDIKYDYLIHEYDTCIQAYLLRRRVTKEEVSSRVYVLNPLENVDLSSQTLAPIKDLYGIERMKKLQEGGEMNTQYIISKTQENYFKQLMDEYVAKLPINGYVVPLAQHKQYQALKEEVLAHYRSFFFGEQPTYFERDTELRYLLTKYVKYERYQAKNSVRYKCLWTLTNQRRQEMMRNYRGRSLSLYDDFRPIYERLMLNKKAEVDTLTSSILNQSSAISVSSFFSTFLSKIIENGIFSRASRRRCETSASVLLIRTILYASSIEFTNLLSIPADFHIETAIINLHIWLLTDRLGQINTASSKFMAKQLLISLKKNQLQSIARIHLKKKNDFIKDISHYMQSNRGAMTAHVYQNPFGKNPLVNPNDVYYRLDALVWSTVFFEKIPRYSTEVYMMAEYFKQQRDYLATCTEKDFEDALIEFDAYRIQPDFVQAVQKYSPRLTEEEFQKEFHSDVVAVKKYYYSYAGGPNAVAESAGGNGVVLPIDNEEGLNSTVYPKLRGMDETIQKTLFKFQTLKTYDYINDLEKQQQDNEKKSKKYAFNDSAADKAAKDIDEMDPDYVRKIRFEREQKAKQLQQQQQQDKLDK